VSNDDSKRESVVFENRLYNSNVDVKSERMVAPHTCRIVTKSGIADKPRVPHEVRSLAPLLSTTSIDLTQPVRILAFSKPSRDT